MRAEIVTIGSELLPGQSVDLRSDFISSHLDAIGLDLFHKVTVGDHLSRVDAALTTALGRADVAITTGDLGSVMTLDRLRRALAGSA